MDSSNEKIYFSNENIFEIVSEVLKKNGLEETLSEVADMEDNEISIIIIAIDLTKKFASRGLSEKDFVLSLQNQLKVSEQTAKNLAEDIKKEILPMAEKVKIEEQTVDDKSATATPIRLINEQQKKIDNIEKLSIPTKEKTTEKRTRTIKDTSKPTEIKEIISSPQKPDTYREPIE